MTGNKKRILYLLLGITAGLAAFTAVELLNISGLPNYLLLALIQGAALGFIFGFTFGFADGIIYKELKTGLLRALIAAAAGALTASAAQVLASQGMLLTARLAGLGYDRTMSVLLPLWRGAGWMLMGAAIGAIDGLQRRAPRRAAAGALGGLIGGLAGGLAFEFLIRLTPGTVNKAAGLILMGALTGLFIGEFERRFSYARLQILNGPFKNREYLIIKRKTTIGGSLRNDITIEGYKTIPEGMLTQSGGEIYFKREEESASIAASADMTLLNDQPFTDRQALKFQDVIQLGNLKLLYLPL